MSIIKRLDGASESYAVTGDFATARLFRDAAAEIDKRDREIERLRYRIVELENILNASSQCIEGLHIERRKLESENTALRSRLAEVGEPNG